MTVITAINFNYSSCNIKESVRLRITQLQNPYFYYLSKPIFYKKNIQACDIWQLLLLFQIKRE